MATEPIAKEWMEDNLGVGGRLREAGEGATTIGRVLAEVPSLMTEAQTTLHLLSGMTRDGLRLAPETVADIGKAENRGVIWSRLPLWIAAVSLAALAAHQLGWL